MSITRQAIAEENLVNVTKEIALELPLYGSHLIEASAGTGKTFTIALLYVRLVLGHGLKEQQGLIPPEILVVTFTEAATRELRDRIRARLADAARYFGEEASGMEGVPVQLETLRADFPRAEWPECAHRLAQAAEWMDEAAVSTIHAWCYRMLREHAFDSLSLFEQTLETDQSEWLAETVRDYWRIFYYPMSVLETEWIASCWADPRVLQKRIQPLLSNVDLLPRVANLNDAIHAAVELRREVLADLKRPWLQWVDELRNFLDQAVARKQVNTQKVQARWYLPWLEKLYAWASNPEQETIDIGTGWSRLSVQGMDEVWIAQTPLPDHPAFAAIASLKPALENLPTPESALLSHAACWIAERFKVACKQRASMGFNDLLTTLDAALKGLHGARLAQTLRQQFPVALIDEFQDTDPVQYAIFNRIYEPANNRQDSALILIGDPKQAIYSFRGADIYTYLQARQAMEGGGHTRLYTLDENFRSTHAMVSAVNHCFSYADQRSDGKGAFLFGTKQGNPVPFHPVRSRGRPHEFRVDGACVPALMFAEQAPLPDGKTLSKTDYCVQTAAVCATRITRWLNAGSMGQAGFIASEHENTQADVDTASAASTFTSAPAPYTPQKLQPLKPGDIAVLVNNRIEAAYIRQALAKRGVRSVYLSDQESVFATDEAVEVLQWLLACATPDDGRLLRAALSTAALGLSWHELDRLFTDEAAWESRVIQFKAYREIWHHQGILPMLRRILFDFDCPHRFLAQGLDVRGNTGERRLTDFLHLAELLQQASFTLDGEQALIRFLSEQMMLPAGDADGRRLRLESDADLVQIVTIHKSKGLEYPLVFLPFICTARVASKDQVPLKWHDEYGHLNLVLKAGQEDLQRADTERLAEDIRKLYVALTRARYVTWLGLAPIKEWESCAFAHLLETQPSIARYQQAVADFVKEKPEQVVRDELQKNDERFFLATQNQLSGKARKMQKIFREAWWIGSYSAIRYEGHSADRQAMAALLPEESAQVGYMLESQQGSDREGHVMHPLPIAVVRETVLGMHGFYKGAQAGTFLHGLMELAARKGFAQVLADIESSQKTPSFIRESCHVQGWSQWAETLTDWMRSLLSTALPLIGRDGTNSKSIRFSELDVVRPEMEFLFEARHVHLGRLDDLVQVSTLSGRERPALLPDQINGMLKGYIDLVFEQDGCYYIADYKSNWLGEDDRCYTRDAMEEAICTHRYDVQYVLYLLALHRLLKVRLSGYDYDRHVGGALYLFVRGIDARPTAGVHFERPPASLIHALDAMFSGCEVERLS